MYNKEIVNLKMKIIEMEFTANRIGKGIKG